MVDGVSLCLACQRAVLSALLASNPIVRPPTPASMRRPSPFTARMGPRPLDRAGAIHGLGCFLDPSRSQETTRLDGGRGSSVRLRVLQGSMGSMGSKQSSPKSQTHQQGSHLLISLERSGVKNC